MQTTEKLLSILDLFIGETIEWTFEDISRELDMPRSTLYRHLKLLTDEGYLTTMPEIGYALGPKIIELDYQIRRHDPLIHAAEPAMDELVKTTPGIALLCRKYADTVICVHQVSSADTFSSNYERGKIQPLLRGAASLVILAELPIGDLEKLYRKDATAFSKAGLGETIDAVRIYLREANSFGWISTSGEVKSGVTGIAAPVFDARGRIIGSLSFTIHQSRMSRQSISRMAEKVVFGARITSNSLKRLS